MKATVYVRLKTEVLDPQGEAVRRALGTMGFEGVAGVRIGKLLANPVIEDYEVVV